ncbi:MAG: phosphoribosylanthranilate isomerase [Cyanobacteriota bacterium]|nr:phosphoribosylanthranilate isomerase [Cyanobacteriota bacterium]
MPESPSDATGTPARRLLLKICGLRDPAQAVAIAAMGVEAIGVVAVAESPRWLSVEDRVRLFDEVHRQQPDCQGVVVVANPDDAQIESLGPGHGHQVVQLHGGETAERCAQLRRSFGPDVALWKALRIRSPEDLGSCEAYRGVVDALLLDAWVPDQLGGTGHRIPLEWLQGFSPAMPWWLAGGITPERVSCVCRSIQPLGLDVSSGVEDGPGRKNLRRVNELIRAMERSETEGLQGR